MNQRGFTLIESVISIALVSLLVVGSLAALGVSTRSQRVLVASRRGATLAQDLMNEIMPLAYDDPEPGAVFGPEPDEGVESRGNWDDIDDYYRWSRTPPETRDGVAIVGAAGWTRTVKVEHVSADDPDGLNLARNKGLRRIAITVTAPDGGQTRLVALRSRSGPIDTTPRDLLTVSWIGAELQIGDDPMTRLASGTSMLNHAASLPPNMLLNPDIESGTSPWWGDTCKLRLSVDEPHGGVLSLHARGRRFTWSGPAQTLSGLENGASYDAEFWVKMQNRGEGDTVQIILIWYDGVGIGSIAAGDTHVDNTAWRPVRATITPTWSGTLQWAYVKVQTISSKKAFLIDDAVVRKVPE